MDLITDLPLTEQGYTNILSIIDRFSKYAIFVPMQSDTTASAVANAFVVHVVRLFGVPKSIVSDRDKCFTSQFWRVMWKTLGVSLRFSSAYHP